MKIAFLSGGYRAFSPAPKGFSEESMIEKMIFQRTVIPLISKGLDAMTTRQAAIAENIANAQSLGFERKVVLFEDELQSRMKKTIF